MKYGELNLGQVEAIVNKLGGMEGVQRILSSEKELRKPFVGWKTIKLGTYKNVDAIKKSLTKKGFKIRNWADDLLNKPAFVLGSLQEEIQLINVSVDDLGFKKGAYYKDICARARELDLVLCPKETGPQLRLQYKNQPKGECLRIAMKPITDSGGVPSVFQVVHDDRGMWLDWGCCRPGCFWDTHLRFIFCLHN